MPTSLRRVVSAVSAAVLTSTLLSVLMPAPAQAATGHNGVCESGEFCLYYNSDNQGSLHDFPSSVSNYGTGSGCFKYLSAGNGKGQCVKNNAASAWNRESSVVTIFYKSGYSGAIDNFTSGGKGNLRAALKNENAGHRVGSSSNIRLEVGLYNTSSARITAYFDGYLNTAGRHEGTDVKNALGASVYALTAGKVIRKTEGYRGSSGLSTLAIYNSSLDKTVIYLHLNPLNGLSVGDSVSKGQKIGVEDYRGISSSGSSHTHVEMRPGYHTSAAVSVGDYTLSNPIPTDFWMNRGYNICCQFS